MNRSTLDIRWLAPFLIALICTGCSVESNLSGLQCDNEGARDGDRVCRDGYWTASDDITGDATDGDDVEPDVADADDTEDDVLSCDPVETVCDGACVDTSTSTEHCGGCGQACAALGDNTQAECVRGECERFCDPGTADDNNDWRDNYDASVGTDGCEGVCEGSETEICDDLDNNCDGRIDEIEKTYYRDGDMDGYGSDDQVIETCSDPPSPYVEQGGDCNDIEPSINPSVNEEADAGSCADADSCAICNGLDDDCDGSIDENCPCDYDQSTVGICATARVDDAGTCIEPDLYEADETTCDQVDNDCDGDEDEGCGCNYDGKAEGVCRGSTVEPNGDCAEPTEYTGDEKDDWCDDGLDNDCDGLTDCEEDGCAEKTCAPDKVCVLGSCCNSPTDEQICNNRGIQCGSVDVTDRCGASRSPDCGGCGGGASCVSNVCVEDDCDDDKDNDNDGDQNCADPDCSGLKCGGGGRICYQQSCCDPPSDDNFCKARNVQCGRISGTDQCGQTRTDVDCGNCGGGSSCVSNSCVEDNCDDDNDNDGDGLTDCEDSDCGACLFEACSGNADCNSGFCNTDAGACEADHCDNNNQDGGESETDCGGNECLLCNEENCTQSIECHSGNCQSPQDKCKP